MDTQITIHYNTCKKCNLCGEVCPNKIIFNNQHNNLISFRANRVSLCFKCGQCMAICPTQSINVNGLSYTKDFFDLPVRESFEKSFFDMILSRRSIRNFIDKPVPKEILERIVRAISLAPPSFPPLKTEIVVVQDSEKIRKALPHMIELYDFLLKAMNNPIARFFIKKEVGKQKFKTMETHLIPLLRSRLPELKQGIEDTITRHAPAMIIFHANYNEENYREDIFIAATFGALAAHALGLGCSIMDIIPPAIEKKKELRELFLIPPENEVVASLIIGYPKYSYRRGIKRELKSIKWL